jgi:hypothetical protein
LLGGGRLDYGVMFGLRGFGLEGNEVNTTAFNSVTKNGLDLALALEMKGYLVCGFNERMSWRCSMD